MFQQKCNFGVKKCVVYVVFRLANRTCQVDINDAIEVWKNIIISALL
jgi:hypothetical protein